LNLEWVSHNFLRGRDSVIAAATVASSSSAGGGVPSTSATSAAGGGISTSLLSNNTDLLRIRNSLKTVLIQPREEDVQTNSRIKPPNSRLSLAELVLKKYPAKMPYGHF
jgi:hypothetical protein